MIQSKQFLLFSERTEQSDQNEREIDREREREGEMEKKEDDGGGGGGGGGVGGYWWWALASSAQMAAGIASYRSGYNGDSRFMPFKAFSVSSLFVGAGATAFAGFLNASGIHKVEDLKRLGANVRSGLGVRPRGTTK